jgi:hypothetical protein
MTSDTGVGRPRRWALAVAAASAASMLWPGGTVTAQDDDDAATVEIAGEYLSTAAVSEVLFEGPGPHDPDMASRETSAPSRVEITEDGRIVTPEREPVPFQRDGATITYSREFPDSVSCIDEETGEVLSSGPQFGEYSLTVVEIEDGKATRLSLRSEVFRPYPPNPRGDRPDSNCGRGNADRTISTGEWVRVQGAAATATTEDGSLIVAVVADVEPGEVRAGEEVDVPLTVTGVRTSLDLPCAPVPAPFDGPLTLESLVLATSGSNSLLETAETPSTARGTSVDVGTPLAVTTDSLGSCSYRQVAELVATVLVPAGTAPGDYSLVPTITGLPVLATGSSSELVLTVVERRAERAAPATRRQLSDEAEFAANIGDVGNRSALAAVLFAAAAAMFSRLRGRRLRALGIFAGMVSLGAGAIELVAGGLIGDVDVGRHLASGAFSMVTGMAVAGGFAFFLPWLSRPDRDSREAGPAIPVALGVWVFALRALDGADIGRAVIAGVVALVIGLIAVTGRSRTRARAFGLVAGIVLMVLTYLGAVVGDDSGTSGTVEAVIGLALAGVAVLIAVFVPEPSPGTDEPGGPGGSGGSDEPGDPDPTPPDAETVLPRV